MELKKILTVLLFLRKDPQANKDLISFYEGKRQESLDALKERVNAAMKPRMVG